MNRGWALLSVAALFLSGVAIGALGMHLVDGHREPPGPPGPPVPRRVVMDELGRTLDLTPEQRDAVGRLLDESRREGDEMRRELRPRLEAHLAETERKLVDLLTPAQRERYEALRKDRHLRPEWLFLGPPPERPGPPGRPPGPPMGEPPDR